MASAVPKKKVLCTFQPADMGIYETEIKPRFPDLDIHLPTTPLMTKEEFLQNISNVEGLVHASVKFLMNDEAIKGLPSSVKIIASHGAGYDGVAVPSATERKIWVSNTPDAVNDSTADTAFILILSAMRRTYEAEKYLREGKWVNKQMNDFMMGREPRGKILGIVGMGGIGKEVAKRARAFGMRIIYHNRRRIEEAQEKELEAEYCPTLDDLLTRADVISVHTPLTPDTTYLFGEKEFEKVKKGAFLVNTARGKVVNTEALVKALKSGKLAGAGLDVFEVEPLGDGWPELREMDNVTLLPHIGTCTIEARSKMLQLCLENVDAVLKGNKPVSPVNEVSK